MHEEMPPGPSPTASDRRQRTKGMLVRPRQQFRYAFLMVAGGILVQSIVIASAAFLMNHTISGVIEMHTLEPSVGSALTQMVNISFALLAVLSAAFALVAVLIGVRLSHRIYGPMVPFLRHIEHLMQGNYGVRMNLRRTDDMVELKDALNNLAETLENKYSKPKKTPSAG